MTSARQGLKPCHEAQCLGLPSLTLTDTNTAASLASLAIPANEESVTALWFYCTLLSLFILQKKFGLLHRFLWAHRRRRLQRQGVALATAATLFVAKDFWRRYSLRRLVSLSSLKAVENRIQPHP